MAGGVAGKRVCGLVSGGKDSNYAFYKALASGGVPVCILSVRPARGDSWMFHVPYTSLVRYQAQAMGLEEIYHEATVSGVKEAEVEELKDILESLKEETGFEVLSVGALASRYQYDRIMRIAGELGFQVYAPAWRRDPRDYMRSIVSEGFRFIITRIAAYGIPASLLGKIIGPREVELLIQLSGKYGFHPAFEGGEAETFVVDAPHYRRRIIVEGEPVRLGTDEWEYRIRRVELVEKA